MTAAEIAALYGPLHAKVPGTRPAFEDEFSHPTAAGSEEYRAACRRALCRSAVLEWLMQQEVEWATSAAVIRGEVRAVCIIHTRPANKLIGRTYDHALVAVAMKVAKTQEVKA